MQYLAIFLIVYGLLCLIGLLLQFPFVYQNIKAKAIMTKIGKKGFDILLLVFGLIALIGGILILS